MPSQLGDKVAASLCIFPDLRPSGFNPNLETYLARTRWPRPIQFESSLNTSVPSGVTAESRRVWALWGRPDPCAEPRTSFLVDSLKRTNTLKQDLNMKGHSQMQSRRLNTSSKSFCFNFEKSSSLMHLLDDEGSCSTEVQHWGGQSGPQLRSNRSPAYVDSSSAVLVSPVTPIFLLTPVQVRWVDRLTQDTSARTFVKRWNEWAWEVKNVSRLACRISRSCAVSWLHCHWIWPHSVRKRQFVTQLRSRDARLKAHFFAYLCYWCSDFSRWIDFMMLTSACFKYTHRRVRREVKSGISFGRWVTLFFLIFSSDVPISSAPKHNTSLHSVCCSSVFKTTS